MSKLLAGRYELLEKIGEGGMAVVYKAKDRLLNRYIAIKILRPEFTKDSQFVENFKKESQAAAGLQHPNIVSVYDVGHEGNIHFIVMELINGRPLSEIIQEEAPLDYKRAIEITKQVASALSIAHKNNIIHRDVKPHNIMITTDGTAKLADFGIAKAVSDSTLATETSKIIGSVHYFSPEQARGAYVDERSDIYSLGIVLYEMLTGQVPFDGDNPVQVALMHINDEIVPPSKLVSGIPPTLEKLVMKATDKFQSNRYKSADELIEDLENIEFVTKMVGNSVFAASDVEEFRRMNSEEAEKQLPEKKKKKKKEKPVAEKEKKPSNGKKKKIIIAVLIVFAFLAAVFGILYATGILDKGVKVPDLKNMTYDDAERELESIGLQIREGDEVPSDEVEKGKIASQTPSEGTKVEKGATVTVMISSGKQAGLIPSLLGKMYDKNDIEAILESHNYVLGDVSYEASDEDKGIIINQTPAPGREAEDGTVVDIIVSSGESKEATVPTLIGITIDEAKQAIIDAGFSVGGVSYDESTVYKKNYVMWQQYEPGSKLKKDTKISIKVSNGAPDTSNDPQNPENQPDDSDSSDDEE